MGDFPEIHLHFHAAGDNSTVLTKLENLEAIMSDNSAALDALASAVADMKSRVAEDVAHLMDLVNQALALETAAEADAAALRADAEATAARITEVTADVGTVDPVADFPGAPTPPPEPTP